MSCTACEPRAEDCLDLGDDGDDAPCTCECHDAEEYWRANGGQVCAVCKKRYREHPHGGPIGMDNKRFLRRLCNGGLVKL